MIEMNPWGPQLTFMCPSCSNDEKQKWVAFLIYLTALTVALTHFGFEHQLALHKEKGFAEFDVFR